MTTMTTHPLIAALHRAAESKGVTVRDCGNGHWQLQGKLLVNYYPFSKRQTAYVAGTVKGWDYVAPATAVEMANLLPPRREEGKNKNRRHRRHRRRLLLKDPHCHWCRVPLTLDSSTSDHVIPLSRGGLDHSNNVVLACKPCNERRGNAMPELRELLDTPEEQP